MALHGDRTTCNIARACALAGVCRRTLYYWMTTGKVEYITTASGSRRLFVDTVLRDGNVTVAAAFTPADPRKPFPEGPLLPSALRSQFSMAKCGLPKA